MGREKRKIKVHTEKFSKSMRKGERILRRRLTRVEIEATYLVHGRIEQHPEACVYARPTRGRKSCVASCFRAILKNDCDPPATPFFHRSTPLPQQWRPLIFSLCSLSMFVDKLYRGCNYIQQAGDVTTSRGATDA